MSGVRTPSLRLCQHDDADGAAQPPEGPLAQLGPDLRARPVDQQPDGLARVAQRQGEEPCPPTRVPTNVAVITMTMTFRFLAAVLFIVCAVCVSACDTPTPIFVGGHDRAVDG